MKQQSSTLSRAKIVSARFARVVQIVFALFLFCFAQTVVLRGQEVAVSLTSQPVIRKIAAGEIHNYSIRLKAREIVRFRFEKGDLRFEFVVFDAEKNQVFQGLYNRFGKVEPWFVAPLEGTYRISIKSLEKSVIGESYKLAITERRAAWRKDFISFQAEEKFQAGEQMRTGWAANYLESARKSYENSALLWQSQKDWQRASAALEQIGEIHLIFGNYQKSLEVFRRAAKFGRASGDPIISLRQLCHISKVYTLLGSFSLAKQYLQAVESKLGKTALNSDNPILAEIFNLTGEIFAAEGNLGEANKFFRKALKIWQNLKHRRGVALSYRNLGYTNIDAGEILAAEEDLAQSLTLARELNDLRGEAFVLTAQGHLSSFFLKPDEALNQHSQALDIFKYVGDRQGEAVVSNGMGNIYESLNRPANAIESYSKALQINNELGNQSYLAVTSFSLARAYRLNKNFEAAEKSFEESLELSRRANKPRLRAYILTAIAGLRHDLGNEDAALQKYRETIAFYQQIGDLRGKALVLGEIGNLFRCQGAPDDAEKAYLEALELNRKIGDNLGVSEILHQLAEIEFRRENLIKALSLLEESISLGEQMREKLRNPTLRTTFQATSHGKIELLINILVRMYENSPQPALLSSMVERIEQWRARVLLELLSETKIEPRNDVSPELLKRERELQNKLALQIEKEMSLRLSAGKPEELENINREISGLTEEYDRIQTKIRAEDPRYEKIVVPPVARLADMQETLRNEPETVYLSYFLSAGKSYLWLIDSSEIKFFVLDDKTVLEDSAREVYRLLTARQRQNGESDAALAERVRLADGALCGRSEKLSSQLLSPIAPLIKGKRLLISLDGALQYVPIEALPAPGELSIEGSICGAAEKKPAYKPVLETNEVVYIPSFSILNSLRRAPVHDPLSPQNDNLAFWADPIYESEDHRVAEKYQRLLRDRNDSGEIVPEPPLIPLSRLLNTREEARKIRELWQSDKLKVFIDSNASKENLLDGKVAQYRFLHIAAHGLFNDSQPENSGLLLSQFDADGKRVDGFLSLKEIFQLRLNADLVVLSACQTGLGAEFPGEGLTGLKQGFFYGGARGTVVSLWQVADSSTAELMNEFYRALLEDQLSAPAALRAARLKVFRQPGWEHPFYWASFTLHGDYSFAQPRKKSFLSSPYFIFLIIFFSIAVIFFGFYHLKVRKLFSTN